MNRLIVLLLSIVVVVVVFGHLTVVSGAGLPESTGQQLTEQEDSLDNQEDGEDGNNFMVEEDDEAGTNSTFSGLRRYRTSCSAKCRNCKACAGRCGSKCRNYELVSSLSTYYAYAKYECTVEDNGDFVCTQGPNMPEYQFYIWALNDDGNKVDYNTKQTTTKCDDKNTVTYEYTYSRDDVSDGDLDRRYLELTGSNECTQTVISNCVIDNVSKKCADETFLTVNVGTTLSCMD